MDKYTVANAFSNYVPLGEKCPKCGGTHTEYDIANVLTSLPQQYNARCKECFHTFYTYGPSVPDCTKPYLIGDFNRGWICPKCGAAVSPSEKVCPVCSGNSWVITCGNTSNTVTSVATSNCEGRC